MALKEPEMHWWVVVYHPDGYFQCHHCGQFAWGPSDDPGNDGGTRDDRQTECPGGIDEPEPPRVLETAQRTLETDIMKNPAYSQARWVYADWLEEHDDSKFATVLRTVPDWFISSDPRVNSVHKFMPEDLRRRCMIWMYMESMFPSYKEEDFRLMFATTNMMEQVINNIRNLSDLE